MNRTAITVPDGFVFAPEGFFDEFALIFGKALESKKASTQRRAHKLLRKKRSLVGSLCSLYGARLIGTNHELVIPKHVFGAYNFVKGLQRQTDLGEGAVNMHELDSCVAAAKAHRNRDFTAVMETTYALGGKRAVRELLGAKVGK